MLIIAGERIWDSAVGVYSAVSGAKCIGAVYRLCNEG